MSKNSIFSPVLAPAPRYLMRLSCIARILDLCPRNTRNFLEIGPGLGDVTAHLLERYPEACGQLIEFSEMAAQQLARRFSRVERLDISSQEFSTYRPTIQHDLILAFEVLEHIEDDLSALRHIEAALRPGGFFIMSVPAFMKKWEIGDDWAGHYRRYEKKEIQEKLSSLGFEIQTLWGYGFPVFTIFYPFRQFFYRANQKSAKIGSKQAASQQSGINRPLLVPGWAPWLARLMAPLFLMQHVARHTDLGDGWIVLARKPA